MTTPSVAGSAGCAVAGAGDASSPAAATRLGGAGTTAILDKAPFERRFRDAMSASQHLQAMWPMAEMVGRHLIGTENVVQFV